MVTPDMIDEELAAKIAVANPDVMYSDVKTVLAYLANNPITPTNAQADELWHHPKVLSGDEHYAKAMARDWQRVSYLKKHDPLPQKLKDIMRGCTEAQRNQILRAYEIGKGESA